MSERYRGFWISDEFAGSGAGAHQVTSVAADGVTLDTVIGCYSTIEEARSAIDGALDGGRECCDSSAGEPHHLGCPVGRGKD